MGNLNFYFSIFIVYFFISNLVCIKIFFNGLIIFFINIPNTFLV